MAPAEPASSSNPPVASGNTRAATRFPRLAQLRVQLSITSHHWTIYPGPPESFQDFLIGFPYELHPLAWDYLKIGSDGARVTIQPHYRYSSWDTFRIKPTGHVSCTALGGLFPFTLGRQPELIKGIRATIGALPDKVESNDPDAAKTLVEIESILDAVEMHLRTIPDPVLKQEHEAELAELRKTARGRAAERHWMRRRRRSPDAPPDLPTGR